jgi:hypothetical protein
VSKEEGPEKLEELEDEDLRKLLLQLDALTKHSSNLEKIETDDQLHAYIKQTYKIDVPRVAVCENHNAPFDLIADLFFQRTDSAILVAGRGGGKTMSSALWQALNMEFFPEVECASVAAVEIQAKRAYQHFKHFQRVGATDKVEQSLISETVWKSGSKYEILTGSISSVNGPHPQKVHRDEVELMDKKVFQESLQMEKSKVSTEGETIPSQTLITSTRKTSDGLMQQLLDECKEAETEGRKAPYKVYIFCIKEVTKNVPNCRVANPELPEQEKCECNQAKNGMLEDGSPRTLEVICGGAFSKSQGFMPIEDVTKTFMKSSRHIWEAQQECKRPYIEDITLPEFTREGCGIRNFVVDPANGPIYQGIDFGGTNPHAAEWVQVLDFDIDATGFDGNPKRLPEGSVVLFSEIYKAEIGNQKLAELIVERERQLREKFPGFKVQGRFADPQAKAARLDFKANTPSLLCKWPAVTRDREEHTKRMRDLLIDKLFYVDVENVKMFVEEVEAWNIKNKTFDHAVDATLYAVSNIYAVEQNRARHGVVDLPSVKGGRAIRVPNQFDDSIPGSIKSPLAQKNRPLTIADKWK